METRWENYEPAPIEFMHSLMMDLFHKFRREKVGKEKISVEIGGIEFDNIIMEAKIATYKKYAKQVSDEPINKKNIQNQ